MARYAIIQDGIVINVIEADAAFAQTVGGIQSDIASPGDLYANGEFTRPPVTIPVPSSVTRGQFKLALLQMDLLDTVEAAIAASDRATQINYAERLDFERNHPLVITMAAALGKTEAEVDALFVLAATL